MILSIFKSLYRTFFLTYHKHKEYKTGKNKSKARILFEQLVWMLKEQKANEFYYAWGLNIRGTNQDEFIGPKEFIKIKNHIEKNLKSGLGNPGINYEVITKDKFYANSLFYANNIPCIPIEGLISRKEILYSSGKTEQVELFLKKKKPFVLKNTILESGKGFLLCIPKNDNLIINNIPYSIKEFEELLGNSKWILQSQIKSHKEIQQINSSALNTTRIVTILKEKEPIYLTGFQSFATNNTEIDSWSKGSIYVGIDPQKNCLKKYGYYHPHVGPKSIVKKHPDSGIIFQDYRITELSNAVELCIKAHKLLYANFIIGWDVAITDQGPLIVEANEKPGMNAVQCVDGAMHLTTKL